jgi:hypothetical protein
MVLYALLSFDMEAVEGATKLAVHVLRICQTSIVPHANDQINFGNSSWSSSSACWHKGIQ